MGAESSSISASSSGENVVLSKAFRLSSIWGTELAPMMTEVTRLSFSSQARAIWARDCPRRRAIWASRRSFASIVGGALLWWWGLTWLVDQIRTKFDTYGIKLINKIIGVAVIIGSIVMLLGLTTNLVRLF